MFFLRAQRAGVAGVGHPDVGLRAVLHVDADALQIRAAIELNISLSAGEKTNLTPATSTEIMIKAAHILLNAMQLLVYFPASSGPVFWT